MCVCWSCRVQIESCVKSLSVLEDGGLGRWVASWNQRTGGVACECWVLPVRNEPLPGHCDQAQPGNINDKSHVAIRVIENTCNLEFDHCSLSLDGPHATLLADARTLRNYGPVGREPQQPSLTSRIHHHYSHSSPACGKCNARLISTEPLNTQRREPDEGDTRAFMCCLIGA